VVRTRVGYAGGTTKNPTYQQVGDHSETLQIDFDPSVITYQRLLESFWQSHNPCAAAGKRQYMTAVFYHSEGQKKLALATRDAEAGRLKQRIVSAILPFTTFHLAENHHQKFFLRGHKKLLREFQAIYPSAEAFMASTAVARVNGYLGGNGSLGQLEMELPSLGLSNEGRQSLRKLLLDAGR
jgi:methionine-S-sulfoxide reductase